MTRVQGGFKAPATTGAGFAGERLVGPHSLGPESAVTTTDAAPLTLAAPSQEVAQRRGGPLDAPLRNSQTVASPSSRKRGTEFCHLAIGELVGARRERDVAVGVVDDLSDVE